MVQFASLPPEIILQIFAFLAVPDLLSLSRTSHNLRTLAVDPVLHAQRLHSASQTLAHYLPLRPSLDSIRPPNSFIYLTRTHLIARSISRSLITIRLSRKLSQRPDSMELVGRGILPKECTSYSSPVSPALISAHRSILRERLKNGLRRKLQRRPSAASLVELNILPEECARRGGNAVAPGLVERRRRVIREGLKDGLRVWVERRAALMQRRKDEGERLGVKGLVRRFTRRMADAGEVGSAGSVVGMGKTKAQVKCGEEVEVASKRADRRRPAADAAAAAASGEGGHSQPTRSHVLGLRRFWEDVIKAAAG
jgi:F-box-like/RPEL repeat